MSQRVNDSDLTVLVLSTDKYKDLWPVFAHYFKAYWANCPYKVHLLTSEESFQEAGIASVQTGKDVCWSDSLISALNQIDSKFVLFLYEDTLPNSPFRNDIIVDALSFLEKVGGTCVRLRRGRFALSPVPNEPAIGRLSTRLPYRNALFISIWDRQKLLTYLKPGESAWDFETLGQARTKHDEGFYAVWDNHFSCIHGVVKGRWFRKAYRRVHNDLPDYSASRPIMSRSEEFLYDAYCVVRAIFVKMIGLRTFRALHMMRWRMGNYLNTRRRKETAGRSA